MSRDLISIHTFSIMRFAFIFVVAMALILAFSGQVESKNFFKRIVSANVIQIFFTYINVVSLIKFFLSFKFITNWWTGLFYLKFLIILILHLVYFLWFYDFNMLGVFLRTEHEYCSFLGKKPVTALWSRTTKEYIVIYRVVQNFGIKFLFFQSV